MDGKILQVQRGRSETNLYMPNPAILHTRSIKIEHYLKIVDVYCHTGKPEVFDVEPKYKSYEPDVYMKDFKGNSICIEVQLTPISTKKMQTKMDEFVTSFKRKEHDAKIMLLVSNNTYEKVKVPDGFRLIRLPLPPEPYTQKKPS